VKIVVTGGAGYIGSVASHRLIADGHEVVVIDDLWQGHLQAMPARATFEQIDVTNRDNLCAALQIHKPDAVFHFAARTVAPESVVDPAPYWNVNVLGTLSLLEAMRAAEVPALVLSSTAAVYGTPPVTPVPEDAPLAPINPYGASKLAAERAALSYATAYGLTVSILRYFNVAGALGAIGEDHRPETHLIPSALDAALGRRGPLSVFGTDFPTRDGTAIRDYVHVEDLVDAHLLALDHLTKEQRSLPPFNLGTRDGASVQEVIDAVEHITGAAVPRELAGRRPGDPAILVADSSAARQTLGWEPKRSTLEDMISSAWDWRRDHPDGYQGNSVAR
jgi:UDP-glucose 4-epimerase